MRIVSTETLGHTPIRHGDLITVSAVSGANILRDVREAITNTFGGKMRRYEAVLDATLERAKEKLAESARAQGYDAVVGVRVSHPVITEGAIEVVMTGTGVWLDG